MKKEDSYNAEDFLQELNKSFVPTGTSSAQVKNPVRNIFRYSASRKVWEAHTFGQTTNNFPVNLADEAGYFVRTLQSGTSKITSTKPYPPTFNIRVESGWSLFSSHFTPLLPLNTADNFLQEANVQGIQLTSITGWDSKAKQYKMHRLGSNENNFTIVSGEGYWLYNAGGAQSFILSQKTTPSPLPTSIPLPPIPQ